MKAGSSIEMGEHDDYEEAELKLYQRLIGKLMYLSCGTRPDIAFVVGQLSRHNADPRVGHMRAAKRVIRYLKGSCISASSIIKEQSEAKQMKVPDHHRPLS